MSCGGNATQSSTKTSEKANSTDSKSTEQEEKVPEKPFVNEAIDSISPNQIKSLKKHLKSATVDEFVAAMQAMRSARTDVEFEKSYHALRPIFTKMETELENKNADPMYWIDHLTVFKKIPSIEPGCAAECTKFLFFWNFDDLKKAAKNTEGDKDERFFALKTEAEGEVAIFDVQWLEIFERTWDYGGGVTVGDNRAYAFLKGSWEFQQESDLFNEDINELRSVMVNTVGHPIYMKKQEEVQAELSKIYKSKFVSSKEKKIIKQWIDRNKAFDTAKEPLLQFGCATGDCDWGG